MEQFEKRLCFILEDLQQMLSLEPGLNRSTYLSMLDAYRALICLYDNIKRNKK